MHTRLQRMTLTCARPCLNTQQHRLERLSGAHASALRARLLLGRLPARRNPCCGRPEALQDCGEEIQTSTHCTTH